MKQPGEAKEAKGRGMSENKPSVDCIIPILSVKDLPASMRFYIEMLGFKLDWQTAMFASVSRDRHAIMLCQGEQGNAGTWIWIGVDDIELLFKDLSAKGVKIRREPMNFSWAHEMQVEDPDGHVLRVGSDTKKDLPIINPH